MGLNPRGLFTGEFESFRAVAWAAVVTPAFPTGPRSLSHETENADREARGLESLCGGRDTKRPRELSLSGLSVNWKDAKGSRP